MSIILFLYFQDNNFEKFLRVLAQSSCKGVGVILEFLFIKCWKPMESSEHQSMNWKEHTAAILSPHRVFNSICCNNLLRENLRIWNMGWYGSLYSYFMAILISSHPYLEMVISFFKCTDSLWLLLPVSVISSNLFNTLVQNVTEGKIA